MIIDIQIPNAEVSQDFKDQIIEKLPKLEQFFENILAATVFIHQEGIGYKLDLKIAVKNDTLFVSETKEHLQDALDNAIEAMIRVIKKYKETTLQKK